MWPTKTNKYINDNRHPKAWYYQHWSIWRYKAAVIWTHYYNMISIFVASSFMADISFVCFYFGQYTAKIVYVSLSTELVTFAYKRSLDVLLFKLCFKFSTTNGKYNLTMIFEYSIFINTPYAVKLLFKGWLKTCKWFNQYMSRAFWIAIPAANI